MPAEDALVRISISANCAAAAFYSCWTVPKPARTRVPELRRQTQFDYKKDLDAALVAFAPTGRFLLLKGRFDWKSLRAYVKASTAVAPASFAA